MECTVCYTVACWQIMCSSICLAKENSNSNLFYDFFILFYGCLNQYIWFYTKWTNRKYENLYFCCSANSSLNTNMEFICWYFDVWLYLACTHFSKYWHWLLYSLYDLQCSNASDHFSERWMSHLQAVCSCFRWQLRYNTKWVISLSWKVFWRPQNCCMNTSIMYW